MGKDLRPGTTDEVVGNILRLAAAPPPRRLFDAQGGLVDPDDPAAVEALALALAAEGAVLTHIYQQGFAVAVEAGQAMDEALLAADGLPGRRLSAEIVQTPDHEAAGEFLVKVLLVNPA